MIRMSRHLGYKIKFHIDLDIEGVEESIRIYGQFTYGDDSPHPLPKTSKEAYVSFHKDFEDGETSDLVDLSALDEEDIWCSTLWIDSITDLRTETTTYYNENLSSNFDTLIHKK